MDGVRDKWMEGVRDEWMEGVRDGWRERRIEYRLVGNRIGG